MSVSKISTQTSTKWGPLDLSKPIGTILPAGMYNATIAEVKVLDGDESLRMIVTFEIQADNGEIVSPEPFWPERFRRNDLTVIRLDFKSDDHPQRFVAIQNFHLRYCSIVHPRR